MGKKLVCDERVINERRKINSKACALIMGFLISSILIQQYIFKAQFSEYATEFICFFCGAFYILIRNILKGNNIITEKFNIKKTTIVNSIVITAVISIQIPMNNVNITEGIITLALTFIIATVFSFLSWFIIIRLNQRQMQKIEKELED